MLVIEVPVVLTIDARGSSCPGPLMELTRRIHDVEVGGVIAVWSSDTGARIDIPAWVERAGHRMVGIEARDGYDELMVEKRQ